MINYLHKLLCYFLIISFISTSVQPSIANAQALVLPSPGQMVNLSPKFNPVVLHGVIVDPKDPLRFDFIVDPGESGLSGHQLIEETTKLAKYFLAGIAIPDEDLWVNLSPYEKNRIIPQNFGITDMGRDLLSEDYLLKQLTATLIYPEKVIGKEFWKDVYAKARTLYGTTEIPINTFNKVWIVPDKAVVYQNGNRAFIAESHLKVMLEEDFLSLQKHSAVAPRNDTNKLGSQVVRAIVLPLLEKEVNEGKNFAPLRQVFSAVILAHWYKQSLRASLVNQVYANSKKVNGIDIMDKDSKEKIYQRYLTAFKKGVYNYIKEDYDPVTQNTVPHKYFSGGCNVNLRNIYGLVTDRRNLTPDESRNIVTGSAPSIVPFDLVNVPRLPKFQNPSVAANNAMKAEDVDQERERIQNQLPQLHAALMEDIGQGKTQVMASLPEEQVQGIRQLAERVRNDKPEHIVIITENSQHLAQSVWDSLKEKNSPVVHFIDPNKIGALQQLMAQPFWGESPITVLQLGNVPDLFQSVPRTDNLKFVEDGGINREDTLSLLVAGIAHPQYVDRIYVEAKRQFEIEKGLSGDAIKNYDPYSFVAQQLALARTGKNVSVLNQIGKFFPKYTVWLAEQMNSGFSFLKEAIWFSGEWGEDNNHASGQAQGGSKGFHYNNPAIEEAEEKGFIGINFINTLIGREPGEPVEGSINSRLRWFGQNFLSQVSREAKRLVFGGLVQRPIWDVDFNQEGVEGIAQMIHFGQVARGMAEKMTGEGEQGSATTDLLQAIQANRDKTFEKEELGTSEIKEDQNIITFGTDTAGNTTLGGILGQQMQGDEHWLNHVAESLGHFIEKKEGAMDLVAKQLGGGEKLIHLNPEKTQKDIGITEAMAKRFKGYKRIYLTAIGGSVSGDYLTRLLGLKEGPEIIVLSDLDPKRLKEAKDDIRQNPNDVGIFVFSKSGSTMETDVNSGGLLSALVQGFGYRNTDEFHAVEQGIEEADKVKEHIVFVTDPQLGDLRALVRKQGYLSIDHPEHGGRFSMFSALGLLLYFVKGGDRQQLEDAVAFLTGKNKNLIKLIKQFNDTTTGRSLKSKLAPSEEEEPVSRQEKINALKETLEDLSGVSGLTHGFIFELLNTLNTFDQRYSYDTGVSLTVNAALGEMVNPRAPFEQQGWDESLGKPGLRFYMSSVSGLPSILKNWDRIIQNKHMMVTLYTQTGDSPEALHERDIVEAMKQELTKHGVPVVVIETGRLVTENLANMMHTRDITLASAAASYEFEVSSEGQTQVEFPKKVFMAIINKVNKRILEIIKAELDSTPISDPVERQRYVNRRIMELRGNPFQIPGIEKVLQMNHDEIEKSIEVPMDFRTLDMPADIADLVNGLLTNQDHEFMGIATNTVRDEVRFLLRHQVPAYLKDQIHRLVEHIGRDRVGTLVLDGQEVTVGTGPLRVVARSLESKFGLQTNTTTGTNIQIYDPRKSETHPEVSIFIQWGSSTRMMVVYGNKAQDYEMLDNEDVRVKEGIYLIENGKPGEINLMQTPPVGGSYISIEGPSSGRPEGFQRFESEYVLESSQMKIRHTGSLTPDNYMMSSPAKLGGYAGWVTWSEAFALSHLWNAVGGACMVMTEHGLTHVKDLKMDPQSFKGNEQVYVYAGLKNTVSQIQVWMNFLNQAQPDKLLDAPIFKIIQSVNAQCQLPDASLELKAAAIMFYLRLKEDLDQFPKEDFLKGDVQTLIVELRKEVGDALQNLNPSAVMTKLMERYLELPLEERHTEENRKKYLLLGAADALLGASVKAGEETKEFIHLKDLYGQSTYWNMLQLISEKEQQRDGMDTQLGVLKGDYEKNNIKRERPVEKDIPEVKYGATLAQHIDEKVTYRKGFGVSEPVFDQLKSDLKISEGKVRHMLNHDIRVDQIETPEGRPDGEQIKIIARLQKEEPDIFETRDGVLYIKSLRRILATTKERKIGANINPTGDISSRLDGIFDLFFHAELRPTVDLIITEESPRPIFGITFGKKDDQHRLVLYLDPIDGSSGVIDGQSFGSIFTWGFLRPHQRVSSGTYNNRRQTLFGYQLQYGARFDLLAMVPGDKTGEGTTDLFALDRDGEFKYERHIKEIDDYSKDEEWNGLVSAKMDKDKLAPDEVFMLAMGGSLAGSLSKGQNQFLKEIIKKGYISAYTGGLVNDIIRLMMAAGLIENKAGVLHAYGRTTSKRNGRFRLAFEGIFYALMFKVLGGQVSDGEQPLLNIRMQGNTPSDQEIPFYAGSSWLVKMIMAFADYIDVHGINEKDYDKEFKKFYVYYKQRTTEMVDSVALASGRSKSEVRKALMYFDSEYTTFPSLLRVHDPQILSKILFASDDPLDHVQWLMQENFNLTSPSFLSLTNDITNELLLLGRNENKAEHNFSSPEEYAQFRARKKALVESFVRDVGHNISTDIVKRKINAVVDSDLTYWEKSKKKRKEISKIIMDQVLPPSSGEDELVQQLDGRWADSFMAQVDHAQIADHAVLAAQGPGGIHLGIGDYLKVINYSPNGMPVYNPLQLQRFKVNFNGFVPVPVGNPRPADLVALSGLN